MLFEYLDLCLALGWVLGLGLGLGTLAVVLGYKVRNCYALSVTHFIRRPLRSHGRTFRCNQICPLIGELCYYNHCMGFVNLHNLQNVLCNFEIVCAQLANFWPYRNSSPNPNPSHNLTLILTITKSCIAYCKLHKLANYMQYNHNPDLWCLTRTTEDSHIQASSHICQKKWKTSHNFTVQFLLANIILWCSWHMSDRKCRNQPMTVP